MLRNEFVIVKFENMISRRFRLWLFSMLFNVCISILMLLFFLVMLINFG